MKSNYLQNLTPEERDALRQKAKESKAAKKLAGESLKQDFKDEAHIRDLSSTFGIRLPASYEPATNTKYIRRAANKLNADLKEYLEYCGAKNLKALGAMNENWPAWMEVGLFLEWYKEKY